MRVSCSTYFSLLLNRLLWHWLLWWVSWWSHPCSLGNESHRIFSILYRWPYETLDNRLGSWSPLICSDNLLKALLLGIFSVFTCTDDISFIHLLGIFFLKHAHFCIEKSHLIDFLRDHLSVKGCQKQTLRSPMLEPEKITCRFICRFSTTETSWCLFMLHLNFNFVHHERQ